MSGHTRFHAARVHPWATTKLLGTWEWHALIVWAVFAAIITPAISAILQPVLTRLHDKLHKQPVAA